MSLVGDCHEVEVTPNLELLVTFDMSLGEFVLSYLHNFTTISSLIWRQLKIPRKKHLPNYA
jgi:hypothetical protein